MSQGLFTAASGIAANQARIDVISDNIANINTVGFKSSQINFETVFSKQLSAGSAPTDDLGGINPTEIGLGVQVGEIGRSFTNGSIQTTGRTTDLNIQGEGFFTLQNYDGEIFLSRAGNFSTDANGYLVNPSGLKVLGTSDASSTTSGTVAVQIPTILNFEIPDATGTDTATNIGQSSGSTVTTGTFTVNVNGTDETVTVAAGDTLADVAANLQTALQTADGDATITATVVGNQIQIDASTDGETISFAGDSGDTSNFLSVMGFTETGAGTDIYETASLVDHSQITINEHNDAAVDTDNNYSVTTFSIANDGAIEATYSNGAKLTVSTNAAGNKDLKYVSATGREITSTSITNDHASLEAAQLQIQLANVINPAGLNAEGGNLFALNSIAGEPSFAMGRTGGMGVINSGSLEASNVDLSREFSNMILAQRGVEACSRTFSVQDRILQTIVNLGR